jgi:hypothetical protein
MSCPCPRPRGHAAAAVPGVHRTVSNFVAEGQPRRLAHNPLVTRSVPRTWQAAMLHAVVGRLRGPNRPAHTHAMPHKMRTGARTPHRAPTLRAHLRCTRDAQVFEARWQPPRGV